MRLPLMKPPALILAALIAGAVLSGPDALALEPAAPSGGSWSFTPAFVSQYMFRGVRLGGPSLQPTLEYSRGALTAGIWGSIPLRDHVADGSESEIDCYASYAIEFPHGLSVVPGVNLYTYPGATRADGYYPLTIEPSLGLNCTIGPVQFTPALYYDFMLKGPTAELTAAFAVPLPAIGTELDFTATIGTYRLTDYVPDTAPAIRNWGDYWLIGVAVPYQFSPRSSLTVGWAYTAGTNNYLKQGTAGRETNPDALGRGVLTVSYTCTF